METRYTKIGIVVVIKKGDAILLGKRLVKTGFGQWGLPGGHLEYNESLVAGARRELLEETGLTVETMKFINITNDPRPDDVHYIHLAFLGEGVRGEPKVMEPEKCERWEWFSLSKLPEPFFFGHKKLLSAIRENKLFDD